MMPSKPRYLASADSTPANLPPANSTYADLPRSLLDFCAILRVQGFTVGPQETQDALEALHSVNIGAYLEAKNALQLVLCATPEQVELFDVLFRAYFLPVPTKSAPPEAQAKASESAGEGKDEEKAPQARKKGASSLEKTSSTPVLGEVTSSDDGEDEDGRGSMTLKAWFSPLSSNHEGLLEPNPVEDKDLLLAASELVKRLRLGRSRRWRSAERGSKFHVRQTFRKSLQTGGEVVKPAWLEHPQRKPRFVLLLDSSRSMASHSDLLLQFAQALAKRSPRVEVFLFSTSLERVTRSLRSAKVQLGDLGGAWGGGTRIGACLSDFVKGYGTGLLDRDTLVLIASDGLDTGRTEVLKGAMRDIHRRSAGVVWLNPLVATEGYEPSAAGMQAALPYIDTFTSAQDVTAFKQLSKRVKLR